MGKIVLILLCTLLSGFFSALSGGDAFSQVTSAPTSTHTKISKQDHQELSGACRYYLSQQQAAFIDGLGPARKKLRDKGDEIAQKHKKKSQDIPYCFPNKPVTIIFDDGTVSEAE